MPLMSLSSDVLHEILRFVTPFHGPVSRSSFLPELLDWRGDNAGSWASINNLMLTSKDLKSLAAPFFYSHLEITSAAKARQIITIFTASPKLSSAVRSVRFRGATERLDERAGFPQHPYWTLYNLLHQVQYLAFAEPTPYGIEHFLPLFVLAHRPLVGLYSLPISPPLLSLFALLISDNRDTLSYLSAVQISSATLLWEDQFAQIELPNLQSLSVEVQPSTTTTTTRRWLSKFISTKLCCPALRKLGLGVRGPPSETVRSWEAQKELVSCQFDSMIALLSSWKTGHLEGRTEVAFLLQGVGADWEALLDWELKPAVLVERIIIVENTLLSKSLSRSAIERLLVHFFAPSLLPALSSIIWVLPNKGKNVAETSWSGSLLQWALAMKGSHIDIQIV